MTEGDNKKKLGLTGGTLSLTGKSSGGKLSIGTKNIKHSSSAASKGKVVVVTKNIRSTKGGTQQFSKQAGQSVDASGRSLTESERQHRLQALQKAEQNREESVKSKNASASTEQTTLDVAEVEAQEDGSTPEVQAEEVRENRVDVRTLFNKGRIRNLDNMYRAPKPEKAEEKQEEENTSVAKKDLPDHKNLPRAKEQKKFGGGSFEEENAQAKKALEDKKHASRKLSVAEVMMMDSDDTPVSTRRRSLASIKRAREKARRKYEMSQQPKQAEKVFREVQLPDFLTVQELANRMTEKGTDVIKALMKLGMMVTVNQTIDADTAELVVSEFGHKVKRVTEHEMEAALVQKVVDAEGDMISRPPVVTIMGHVDHGKTSLLDALRETDVVAGEAGGITQHIGAYQVTLSHGKAITFLDTPGHEAFTAMRMRGARVTDIVVLVVAADDGIMQQTLEAISHAKAANVPIIVAINKIDKPEANSMRVKQELLSHGLVPEDLGGDTIVIEVSAKAKINLDKLEDSILLQAELLDLKANKDRLAEGAVIESKVDKGRGTIATLLVQKGTLKSGDIVVAGTAWGKIRALVNDKGKTVAEAKPSSPIEILGLDSAPTAGDDFIVVKDEKNARDLVTLRQARERQKRQTVAKQNTLETMFNKARKGVKELAVIIKGDVQGSVEAISQSLAKLKNEEISVKVVHSGVGGVTESDVTLAGASQAIIIGFNVRANQQAKDMAKNQGIDIRYYSIIYNLVDEIRAAMSGMLSPVIREQYTGVAEVRQVISLSKFGKIAGCYVVEGMIKRNANARVIRDSVVVHQGKIKALKRFKDDVKEVNTGFECGLSFENFEDIKVNDKVEVFELIEETRTL